MSNGLTQEDYRALVRNHKGLLAALPSMDRQELLELRQYIVYRLGSLDRDIIISSHNHRLGENNDEHFHRMRLAGATMRSSKKMINDQLLIYDELHPNEAQDMALRFHQTAMRTLTPPTYALIMSQVRTKQI